MNVGKDPFPRDEVTGLAAFEHVEPVGSVSVISEKSREIGVPSSNSNAEREPITRPRADATLPLDLAAMGHWVGVKAPAAPAASDDHDNSTDADELDDLEELAASSVKRSALDAMFDKSAGLDDWDDDDEATRVHSRPAGRGPNQDDHDGDEPHEGELEMEWDDDEPPTETLPFALLEEPPIAARVAPEHDHQQLSVRSATATIRTPPVDLRNTLPPPVLEAKSASAGRPSPFPPDSVEPVNADRISDYGYEDEDEYDSAFSNLMPLPAPQLPAPVARVATPAPVIRRPSSSPNLQASARAAFLGNEIPATFIEALKAGHRPSVIVAAGGAVGLLALVLIARAIILTTNVGTAVLEVSPADAQVQVDGKAVAGTGSPYSVSDLKSGSHELLVKKRGYNDYRSSFAVSAGQSTKLPVAQLAPNLLDVGFAVRSTPAGAAVWLDGELTEAITPAKLTGIKPGIHRLALKREGFSDYELQMFVPEATVLQLPAAELVAVPGLDAEPVNARRRAGSRKSRGYGTNTSSVSAETLTSVSARHASSGYGAPDAAGSGKTGTLRLNSRPWAQVSVDGRQVGNTPQPSLQLSAGKHKVQLLNPQLGVNKSVMVTIKAGETLTQVVNLAD